MMGPPDRARENPVSHGRKLLPEGQALSVVHVEGRQQQDVRHTHCDDVQADPSGPALAPSSTPSQGRCEGQGPKDE